MVIFGIEIIVRRLVSKKAVEELAVKDILYQDGAYGKKVARVRAVRTIKGWSLSQSLRWVERTFGK